MSRQLQVTAISVYQSHSSCLFVACGIQMPPLDCREVRTASVEVTNTEYGAYQVYRARVERVRLMSTRVSTRRAGVEARELVRRDAYLVSGSRRVALAFWGQNNVSRHTSYRR